MGVWPGDWHTGDPAYVRIWLGTFLGMALLLAGLVCGGWSEPLDFKGLSIPTNCTEGVLTVQIDNRRTGAVNVHLLQHRGQNLRNAPEIATNVVGETTRAICLDPWVGRSAYVVIDPVGGHPFHIMHAGETFASDTDLLWVRVDRPKQYSTMEVR